MLNPSLMPVFAARMTAGHEFLNNGNVNAPSDYFGIALNDSTTDLWNHSVTRGIRSGSLHLDYSALDNTMTFSAKDAGGNVVASDVYNGFRNYATSPMNIILAGRTEGNQGGVGPVIALGDANLDNFSSQGNVAPEPISSALFLLGGGALALMRRKRK